MCWASTRAPSRGVAEPPLSATSTLWGSEAPMFYRSPPNTFDTADRECTPSRNPIQPPLIPHTSALLPPLPPYMPHTSQGRRASLPRQEGGGSGRCAKLRCRAAGRPQGACVRAAAAGGCGWVGWGIRGSVGRPGGCSGRPPLLAAPRARCVWHLSLGKFICVGAAVAPRALRACMPPTRAAGAASQE